MKSPKILAIASAIDLDFRYGCTPAWWQLWKGMYEAGVDLVVTPYRGRPVESPWWRVAPNPTYREGESYQAVRNGLARLKGDRYLRREESSPEDSGFDKLTREAIRRFVTPRWKRHLERLVERERPDAILVFTIPMPHLSGIPTALRERFGIPVVFYDGDVPMSLPEYGGMDTGFNPYHGADPSEYDLVLSNSEGGIGRLLELGAQRAEAVFWAADPEFFAPQPVEKEVDVFFYGYGDKFRRDWMQTMVGEPSRLAPDIDLALGGLDFQGDTGTARGPRGHSVQRVCACDLGGPRQPEHHSPAARHGSGLVHRPAVRARILGGSHRLEPARGDRALVRARVGAGRGRVGCRGRRDVSGAPRGSWPGGGDGSSRARARPRRAHVRASSAPAARARGARCAGSGMSTGSQPGLEPGRVNAERRIVAIVPAWNESGAIGAVVDAIRGFDPRIDVVVVDDASADDTAAVAEAHGATVLRLPFNVGIGGAVQTGFKYAVAHGYELAVRLDGDGQHDPTELPKLLAPIESGEADLVIGSRFVDQTGSYRPPFARRLGIRFFARLVSLLGGQRVTDTTSGFIALDRIGIQLFAEEYPHDYPEVEGTLVALRSGLRLAQVQVEMRERETGSSSITFVRSLYYIVKVMLALLVTSLRRYPRLEGAGR